MAGRLGRATGERDVQSQTGKKYETQAVRRDSTRPVRNPKSPYPNILRLWSISI